MAARVAVPAHAPVTGLNRHELTVSVPFVVSLSDHERSNEFRVGSIAHARSGGTAQRSAQPPRQKRPQVSL